MEHEERFGTAAPPPAWFAAAVRDGDEGRVLSLSTVDIRAALECFDGDREELLIGTPSEAIFERLLLADRSINASETQASRLYHRGLALGLPLQRLTRLLLLVGNEHLWHIDAFQAALLHERSDVAALLLPFCPPDDLAALDCDEEIARLGIVASGVAARTPRDEWPRKAERLLATARSGKPGRLRLQFRQFGLLYHALGTAPTPAERLFEAALESGCAETADVVFLHTSLLRDDRRMLETIHALMQGSAAVEEATAESEGPPAFTAPLTREADVDAFLERIRVMDKDVVGRVERMVGDAFRDTGYERALGRPVRPEALEPLRESFPLFSTLIDDIQARTSLLWRVEETTGTAQAMRLPNILIVGKPGWGKTYFIHRLGEILGLPFRSLQMSSLSAGFILAGSDPTWSTSRPGMIHDTLARGTVLNPLFLLDEIDKIGSDTRYPADGPLYQLLEPQHARAFQDECLSYPIDASHINWFAAANDIERAHPAIVSRFDVYEMPEPTAEIARQTARSVYRESLERSPWRTLFDPEPAEEVIEELSRHSPREAHRRLQKAFGRASLAGRTKVALTDFGAAETVRRRIGFLN